MQDIGRTGTRIRLLHGISPADLRQACLQGVFDLTDRWPDKRALLIVPEQAKLDFEQAYLHASGHDGLLMAEVLSFRRLAARLAGETGQTTVRPLDASGQGMLLYQLLKSKPAKTFPSLSSLVDRPGYLGQIAAAIGDLRRCQVDAATLEAAAESLPDLAQRRKISDLAHLMATYHEALARRGLRDGEDDLDALASLLAEPPLILADRLDWLGQTSVWIAGFGELRNFTPQEYAVIAGLATRCETLTVTVLADTVPASLAQVEWGPDIFLSGRRTAWQLKRVFHPQEITRVEPAWSAASAMLAGLLTGRPEAPEPAILQDFIQLVQTRQTADQVIWLAGEIRNRVDSGRFRYQDLVVALCNPEEDLGPLKAAFAQFGIPLFLDQARSAAGSALARTVLGLLDLAVRGWTRQTVMRVLRAGLLTEDQDQVDRLENDLLALGLFRFDRFQAHSARLSLGDTLANLLSTTHDFTAILLKADTGDQKVAALVDFIESSQLAARTADRVNALATAGDQESALALAKSWNALVGLLAQIRQLAGSVSLGLDTFRDLLAAGFDQADSGVLPSALDQVAVGDLNRSHQRRGRVLFVLGAQSDQLPPKTPPEGLLRENDRALLSDVLGQTLPNKARDQVYADAAMVYSLLLLPTDRLVLVSDQEDPSPYFQRLAEWSGQKAEVLPEQPQPGDVRLRSSVQALHCLLPLSRQPAGLDADGRRGYQALAQALWLKGLWPRQAPDWLTQSGTAQQTVVLSPEAVEQRLGETLALSVSQLEKYAACPFMHWAAYGLELRDRPQFEPAAAESGTVLHALAEITLREFSRQGFERTQEARLSGEPDQAIWPLLADAWLDHELDRVLDAAWQTLSDDPAFAAFFVPGQQAGQGRRLNRVARTSLAALVNQFKLADFRPRLYEWTFRPEQGNALILALDSHHRLVLRGIVDRIDQRQLDDQTQFRVIDYKSGRTVVNFDTLYHGLAMQLPIYLAAFSASEPGSRAADACYFQFDQPVFSQPSPLTPDPAQISQWLARRFKLRSLDLEPELLERVWRHSLAKARGWAGEMLAGQFSARPRLVSGAQPACTYCAYRVVCGFDPRRQPCQVLPQLGSQQGRASQASKKQALLDQLAQEDSDAADD